MNLLRVSIKLSKGWKRNENINIKYIFEELWNFEMAEKVSWTTFKALTYPLWR